MRRRSYLYRSAATFFLLAAASTGVVVVEVAGIPPPATGTVGENGPATEAALNLAESVAVALNGDIYIADFNTARLLRIRDGILTVPYRGGPSENDFSGVAAAPDGTVYFTTGLAVTALDPDGTVREILPTEGSDQVFAPKLAVAADGTVYLGGGRNPRVDRIEADGSTTLVAGSDERATEPAAGEGQSAIGARFGRTTQLLIDSQGIAYVADEDFGDVRRVDPDGTITTVFGAGSIPFADAVDGTRAVDIDYGSAELGIALDSSDRLHIVPRLLGKVWLVEEGEVVTVAGGGGNRGIGFPPLETQFEGAFRIAFTPDDDLLILIEDGRFLYRVGGVRGARLVDSVPAPADINLDPIVVAVSIGLTAGMLLLIPFPAEIFNNTLAENHDQIRAWFRRRQATGRSTFWQRPGGLVAALLVMALLYGFLDPGFGLNAASLPTLAGLLAGVLVTTLGFVLPTMLVRRSRTGEWGRMRALPVALLVGILCVIISRIIGFVPGYLYGMVLGLVFAREVGEEAEAREVIVAALVLFLLAFGAWFGLGTVRGGEGAAAAVLEAALAMTTVAAFEGLVFGLLPIHGMPGRVLFKQGRRQWIAMWGLAVLAFFHVLVNPQSGYLVDTALVPVATTYGLLAGFTIVSLAMWGWFRLRSGRRPGS